MQATILLAATDPTSLAVYGVAAFPISLLLFFGKWCLSQMADKDVQIGKLNERIVAQGEAAIAQAERLAPLVSNAAEVIKQTAEVFEEQQLERRFKQKRRKDDVP